MAWRVAHSELIASLMRLLVLVTRLLLMDRNAYDCIKE